MTKIYPAVIHKEDNSFWIEFPDLSGCNTCGTTLEETIGLASEALGLYLVSLLEDGKELPAASDIDTFEGCTTYISTDLNQYRRDTRAVKKMLSIPAWLAKEAEQRNLSLSKVLQEALQEKLHLV